MFSVPSLSRRESVEERNNRQAKILNDATRQFSAIVRPTLGEIDAYKELFYQLIAVCNTPSRRLISASLASFAYTPVQIAIFLASDAAEVATPMLLFSPVISETHVVRLAVRLPREHLRVLCRRSDLSASAIKALLTHGGEEAAEVLRANPALRSHAALFAAAMPLPRPAEQPEPVGAAASAELLRLANVGGRTGRRPQAAPSLNETGLAFDRRLLLAARGRRLETIAALIAAQSGATVETIDKFLSSGETEPLLVFLKGLSVDNVTAMQVLLLVRPQIGSDRQAFTRTCELYRRIDAGECEAVLRVLASAGAEAGATIERRIPDFAEAARNRRAAIAAMGLAPMRHEPRRAGHGSEKREPHAVVAQ